MNQEPNTEQGYNYWDNLELDYGFSSKEMQGINRAIAQKVAEAEDKMLDLIYWKYKELNDQSVDMKFVEAYNILKAELKADKGK